MISEQKKVELTEALGAAGEKIAMDFYSRFGYKVTPSTNKWDNQKDILVVRDLHEVKTEAPYINKASFTVKVDQIPKLINADCVNFIAAPSDYKEYDGQKVMYELRHFADLYFNKKFWKEWVDPKQKWDHKREMLFMPMKFMTPIYALSDKEWETLKRVSLSGKP